MSELADVVVRDPFKTPKAFRIDRRLAVALDRVLGERVRDRLLISERASVPQGVMGAKVHDGCAICLEPVWVAPSSQPLIGAEDVVVVCSACVLLEVRKLELEGQRA